MVPFFGKPSHPPMAVHDLAGLPEPKPRPQAQPRRRAAAAEPAGPEAERKAERGHRRQGSLERLRQAVPCTPAARHDAFNLVALPLLLVLVFRGAREGGDAHLATLAGAIAYFAADSLWIALSPASVKSARTILAHHAVVAALLAVPVVRPYLREFVGKCLTVELNTTFLIARRLAHKRGWPTAVRRSCSALFYATWVAVRLVYYPYLAATFVGIWWEGWRASGRALSWELLAPVGQIARCVLNLKWSVDLVRNKARALRTGRSEVGKGL